MSQQQKESLSFAITLRLSRERASEQHACLQQLCMLPDLSVQMQSHAFSKTELHVLYFSTNGPVPIGTNICIFLILFLATYYFLP